MGGDRGTAGLAMNAGDLGARLEWPAACIHRLARYTEVLDRWQRAQRLVGWSDAEALWREGLADACVAADLAGLADGPIVDLGSGAGLPGLMIAARWPERSVHLVEARRKRASFLLHAAEAMGLSAVRVHGERLERLRDRLGPVGLLTGRAFARPADVLTEATALSAAAVLLGTSRERLREDGLESPPAPWVLHVERGGLPAGRGRVHWLLRR